jgi:transposase
MAKKYLINLTSQEQADLETLINKGKSTARIITRARILNLSSEGKSDSLIASYLKVGVSTVERIRKKFIEGGLTFALSDRPNPGKPKPKLDEKQEAFLIATACSDGPDGYSQWTMQLLADRLVELKIVESISDETVRRILKKRKINLVCKKNGVSQQ